VDAAALRILSWMRRRCSKPWLSWRAATAATRQHASEHNPKHFSRRSSSPPTRATTPRCARGGAGALVGPRVDASHLDHICPLAAPRPKPQSSAHHAALANDDGASDRKDDDANTARNDDAAADEFGASSGCVR